MLILKDEEESIGCGRRMIDLPCEGEEAKMRIRRRNESTEMPAIAMLWSLLNFSCVLGEFGEFYWSNVHRPDPGEDLVVFVENSFYQG